MMCEVWKVGVIALNRLQWLGFGEISRVKSYKQFKFLVFSIFKWVFRRFVSLWDIFTKVTISCVKSES